MRVPAPIAVLLPARWRVSTVHEAPTSWRVASFICGLAQCCTGLAALVWWYSYSVANWASTVVSHATATQPALSNMKPHETGVLALMVVVTNPITWVILAWCIEGLVRILAAAITEEVFATLPLAIIAGTISLFRPVRAENPGLRGANARMRRASVSAENIGDATLDDSPAHSFAHFLRRGLIEHTHARVPDHITRLADTDADLLRIRSSHTKPDWEPGRIVLIDGAFYRIDNFSERHGAAAHTAIMDNDGLPHTHTHAKTNAPDTHARPFVYRLRRLSAGIVTRHTLHYEISPESRATLDASPAPAAPHHSSPVTSRK
jgi:hypothetical protein